MRKGCKIVLFIIAFLYIIANGIYSIRYFVNIIQAIIQYIQSKNLGYIPTHSMIDYVGIPILHTCFFVVGQLFALIYIVYTLKNGFGATLYSSLIVNYEDIKNRYNTRKEIKRLKKIKKYNEKIDKLNQENE